MMSSDDKDIPNYKDNIKIDKDIDIGDSMNLMDGLDLEDLNLVNQDTSKFNVEKKTQNTVQQKSYSRKNSYDIIKEYKKLEEKNHMLENSLDAIKSEKENLENEINFLKQKKDNDIDMDINNFKIKINILEEKLKTYDSKSNEYENTINGLEEKIVKLETENNDVIYENENLKHELDEISSKNSSLKEEANESEVLIAQIKQLKEELNSKKSELKKYQLIINSNKNSGTNNNGDKSSSMDSNFKQSTITKSATAKNASIVSFINTTDRTTSLGKNIEEFETEKLTLAEKLVKKSEKIRDLEGQLVKNQEQMRQLEAGMEGIETRFLHEISYNEKHMKSSLDKAIKRGNKLIETVSNYESKVNDVKTKMDKFVEKKLDKLKKADKKLQEKDFMIGNIENEKQELQAKCVEAQKKVHEVMQIEKKYHKIKKELEDAHEENHDLKDIIDSQKGTIDDLNMQIDKYVNDTNVNQKKILLNALEDKQKEIKELNERIVRLETGLSEYERKNKQLQDDLEKYEEDHLYSSSLEFERTADNSFMKKELSDLRDKLLETENENINLKKDLNSTSKALNHFEECEEEVIRLKNDKKDLENNLSRKKKHIEDLQIELQKLRLQIQMQDNGSLDTQSDTSSLLIERTDSFLKSEQRYTELERLLSEVVHERDYLIEEKRKFNKCIQDLTKTNAGINAAREKLESENEDLKKCLFQKMQEISKLENEIEMERVSNVSNQNNQSNSLDNQLTEELVMTKLMLAEMDGNQTKLKHDLHKAYERNMKLASKMTKLETLLNSRHKFSETFKLKKHKIEKIF